jgi:DNA-binding transcriptional regulator YiaG
MRCPSCRRSQPFETVSGAVTIMGVSISTHGQRCAECGEVQFEAAELDRQERELADAIVGRGIRTGSEFELIRKALGISGPQLANLFGVQTETIAKWEANKQALPTLVAFALGELYARPMDVRHKLEAIARQS